MVKTQLRLKSLISTTMMKLQQHSNRLILDYTAKSNKIKTNRGTDDSRHPARKCIGSVLRKITVPGLT